MRSGEVKALGRLAGEAVARPGVLARDVHRAVAGRTFGALGFLGAPVRVAHDAIANAAYAAVHTGLGALPRASAVRVARALPADAAALSATVRGSLVLGALNGAIGDALVRDYGDLALELVVRRGGREVVTDSPGLADAYPDATPKLAVFLHGLGETDEAWRVLPLAPRRADRRTYGARLREELGYTPVYVRYNTGLHVSDNARRLSEVLDHVVRAWPVEVEEIAIVGHSMGGLVARGACHYGERDSRAWTNHVRHVFCLGTPHMGAPLERAANAAGWAIGRLPETRPFAALVNGRSAGIKDLRFGSCVEDDWCDCDPDELLHDRCAEVPFLACATYYFVGATLTRDEDSPFGRIVGDLLVQFPSASGRGRKRTIPFEIDDGCHVGGIDHFQLLNHPKVYEQLRAWLERPPRQAAAKSLMRGRRVASQ
ncbi:MAG: esterase/lipase family protein [Gaiellaceae bacterium]